MGAAGSTTSLQKSKTQDFIGGSKGDIFKEIKGHMNAIERSRSKTDMRMHNELQKSASKSRFLEEVKVKKKRAQSVHEMTFEEEEGKKSNKEHEKDAEEKLQKTKEDEKAKKETEKRKLVEEAEKKKIEEEAKTKRKSINPYDDAPKKMDDIFGPLRDDINKPKSAAPTKTKKKQKTPSPSPPPLKEPSPPLFTGGVYVDPNFDPRKKEIKGMSENVQLKKSAKNKKEPIKKEPESKLSQRDKLFANMGKPAKFL